MKGMYMSSYMSFQKLQLQFNYSIDSMQCNISKVQHIVMFRRHRRSCLNRPDRENDNFSKKIPNNDKTVFFNREHQKIGLIDISAVSPSALDKYFGLNGDHGGKLICLSRVVQTNLNHRILFLLNLMNQIDYCSVTGMAPSP